MMQVLLDQVVELPSLLLQGLSGIRLSPGTKKNPFVLEKIRLARIGGNICIRISSCTFLFFRFSYNGS